SRAKAAVISLFPFITIAVLFLCAKFWNIGQKDPTICSNHATICAKKHKTQEKSAYLCPDKRVKL
ncbi:MAG: hypothetical protein IJ924_03130, partial [Bacteroidaceae bacterium]|nr:hypothetical protein [Bacteroidaceae bacterium]